MKARRMRARQWIQVATVASAVGLIGTAVAADYDPVKVNDNAAPNAAARDATMNGSMATDSITPPVGHTPETAAGSGMDRMSTPNLDKWMNEHASTHNGRITREEFMAQMSNRWDTLDTQRQGYLTPDQVRSIYGRQQPLRATPADFETASGGMAPGTAKN